MSEAFCIFPRDSREQAEKTPSKKQSELNWQSNDSQRGGQGRRRFLSFSSLHYGSRREAVNLPLRTANGPPIGQSTALPKENWKSLLCWFLASRVGLSLMSPWHQHPHAHLSRNILMQHYPILTPHTSTELRRCFWWSFSHSTQFGNGANLYKQPACERGGFATPLSDLRMDGRTDGWGPWQAPIKGLCEL